MKKLYAELNISSKKGVDINDGLIGLFFEDLSNSADGGLYAEQIENRSFEQQTPVFKYTESANGKKAESLEKVVCDPGYGWTVKSGSVEYLTSTPLNENNTHYARLTGGICGASLQNKAYDGVYAEKDKIYNFSAWANLKDYSGDIEISVTKDGKALIYGKLSEEPKTRRADGWARYSASLASSETADKCEFTISLPALSDGSSADLDMVSMMPNDAVLGIFRRDMTEAIREINPGFLRFPGGCVVEGYNLSNRYRWKDTVGPIEQRKQTWNRWACKQNTYNETYGIGFYEYFLLCEYLKCCPVPILNVGMACEYNTSEVVPLFEEDGVTYTEEFMEYINDAIDLIEFANGSTDTRWGGLRAQMGHPAPFNLRLLGIGNEQWVKNNNQWHERYEAFEKAIHELYPEIKLISSAGPKVADDDYYDAWQWVNARQKDNPRFTYAVDEHNYNTKEWFFENIGFYDGYSRDIPVYLSEYASKVYVDDNGEKRFNNLISALSEAAFLTGIERNADVVKMASYAPLFSKAAPYSHWAPNMIWFDDTTLYKTPNYYVQKLYSNNMGSYTLKSEINQENINQNCKANLKDIKRSCEAGLFFSVSYDEKTGDIIVKAVNPAPDTAELKININKSYNLTGSGKKFVLWSNEAEAANSFAEPNKIKDEYEDIECAANNMTQTLNPYSLTVLRLNTKNI